MNCLVGDNLQDYLQLRMGFKVKNVITLNQRVHSLFGKMAMGMEYALFRTGPLTGAKLSWAASLARRPSTNTKHRVPRAAADARQVWRAVAPFSGIHCERR